MKVNIQLLYKCLFHKKFNLHVAAGVSLSFYLRINSLRPESMTAGVWCYVVILSPPNVWIWLRCSRSQEEHMASLFRSCSCFWTLSENALGFACSEQGSTMKIFFFLPC